MAGYNSQSDSAFCAILPLSANEAYVFYQKEIFYSNNSEFTDFLVNTAGVVERMSLMATRNPVEAVIPTSFLGELLSRRCTNVILQNAVAKFTHYQVEELVQVCIFSTAVLQNSLQFLNHAERKVSLTIAVIEPIIETQIGEILVKIIGRSVVNITHVASQKADL